MCSTCGETTMQMISSSVASKYLEVFARVQNVMNEFLKKTDFADSKETNDEEIQEISSMKAEDDTRSEVQFLTIRDLDTGLLTIKNLDTGDAQSISENDPTFDFNAFDLSAGDFVNSGCLLFAIAFHLIYRYIQAKAIY